MFAGFGVGVRRKGEKGKIRKLNGHERGKETLIIEIYVHNVVTCFFNFFVSESLSLSFTLAFLLDFNA